MNPHEYDIHQNCREALHRAYEVGAQQYLIKQVIRQCEDGSLEVFQILQVDLFEDGARILVR